MARDIQHLAGDLAKRVDTLEDDVLKEVRALRRKVAIVAKDAQLEQIEHDVGSDRRLSRVRSGKGAKIGIKFQYSGDDVLVTATGPIQLVANPTKPHDIPKAVGTRGRARKRLTIAPGIIRAAAHHPGTPGKDTFNKGREIAEPRISATVNRDMDAAVTRSFHKGS